MRAGHLPIMAGEGLYSEVLEFEQVSSLSHRMSLARGGPCRERSV